MSEKTPTIRILDREIGSGHPCYVIAEAGLNHNGSFDMAKRLIDTAVVAGAECVKFQKRTVSTLATGRVLDAKDGRFPEFGSTYREIREHLEFSLDQYRRLKDYADERCIGFLVTAFDVRAADFLQELGVDAFKVASHSLTNLPLLDHLARIGKPVILSTGMCTISEIDEAVGIFSSRSCPLALLHCVSSYPQPEEDSNLNMLGVLRERYGVPVGYSGHEIGYVPTLASVALGASLVERHITLNSTLPGFDHKLSLEPDMFVRMVRDLRKAESTLGSGLKVLSDTEMVTRRKYRVSIVAAKDIQAGQIIGEGDLMLKNPGTGLPSRRLRDVVGRRARVKIQADDLLEPAMVEGLLEEGERGSAANLEVIYGKSINISRLKAPILGRLEDHLREIVSLTEHLDETETAIDQRSCYVCASVNSQPFSRIHGFDYVECEDCGHVYTTRRYDDAATRRFYEKNEYWSQVTYANEETCFYRRDHVSAPKVDFIERYLDGKSGTWLDVGAGIGDLVSVVNSRGWRGIGLEISEASVAFSARVFEVELVPQTLQEFAAAHPELEGELDVLSCMGLIEHVVNPLEHLELAARLLRRGGCLAVQVPNADSVTTLIQKVFPENVFRHMSPVEHIMLFTRGSLVRALELSGFRPEALWFHGLDVYELLNQLVLINPSVADSQLYRVFKHSLNELQLVFDRRELSDRILCVARKA